MSDGNGTLNTLHDIIHNFQGSLKSKEKFIHLFFDLQKKKIKNYFFITLFYVLIWLFIFFPGLNKFF